MNDKAARHFIKSKAYRVADFALGGFGGAPPLPDLAVEAIEQDIQLLSDSPAELEFYKASVWNCLDLLRRPGQAKAAKRVYAALK